MYKIYNPGHGDDALHGCFYKNFLQFDIEDDRWTYTPNMSEADFISIHGHDMFGQDQIYDKVNQIKSLNLRPNQKILINHIFHIDHCFPDHKNFLFLRKILQQELPNEFAILHTNFALDKEIQYDYLWNRQKIYFTDYNRIPLKERLYVMGSDIKNFELIKIQKHTDAIFNEIRKFICPNRVYNFSHPRLKYRRQLLDFIKDYEKYGHYSDPLNGRILEAENPYVHRFLNNGGWYPIANHYYNGTFFSLYVETIPGQVNDETRYKSITEKTWDPLIKGHFILPFGYRGLIDHIRSYGFKLPDWIDYSYDMIENDDDRFDAFLESAEKLMKLSIDEFQDRFNKDKDILLYNRRLFWERPYDSLYDKVVDFFNNYY